MLERSKPLENSETGPLLCQSLYTDYRLTTLAVWGVVATIVLALLLELLRGWAETVLDRSLGLWETFLLILPMLVLYRLYVLWTVRDLHLFRNRLYLGQPGGWRVIDRGDIEAVSRKGDWVRLDLVGRRGLEFRLWPSPLRRFLRWAGEAIAERWQERLASGESVLWFTLETDQGSQKVRIATGGLLLEGPGLPTTRIALEDLIIRIGPNGCRIGSLRHPSLDLWADNGHPNLYAGYYLVEEIEKNKLGITSALSN